MNGNLEILAFILFLALLLYMLLSNYFKKREDTSSTTKELLVCPNCNYSVEVDFEPGDFIGLIKGQCPRCSSKMRIKGIYST